MMIESVHKESSMNTMTDWKDLYHRNQLSSLREGELELYINHHNMQNKKCTFAFKGKKDEKVRVVNTHIGSTAVFIKKKLSKLNFEL